MQSLTKRLGLVGLLAGLGLLCAGAEARAQVAQPDSVRFETPDGVSLRGTWYPGKAKAPVALLLHDLKQDHKKNEWQTLATELQKKGFAVLAFDFRGHGDSTTVDPKLFWTVPANQRFVKLPKGANQDQIKYETFDLSNYYPYMVNDIAAARAFLDLKNDAGECNSSSIVLVGAGYGATLGSIWLNSEWYRYRYMRPQIGFSAGGPDPSHRFGKDTIACIWLSIQPTKAIDVKNLGQLLKTAGQTEATPMVFIYNSDDKYDPLISKAVCDAVKPDKNENIGVLGKYTDAFGVKNAGEAKGRELLAAPGMINNITQYLEKIVDEKGRQWVEQAFLRTDYVWVIGLGRQVVARVNSSSPTFNFTDFRQFIP